jgi:dTDP-4-dehydrorhamnose reductase
MKILILGKNGQLGWELQRTLLTLGQVTAWDYEELNLEHFDTVRDAIRQIAPDLIVNASAYTAVDKAETEVERAQAINGKIPGILAEEMKSAGGALIHYSTDYVFDGTLGHPYQENDTPNPLSIYGKSKLEGELAIQTVGGAYLILRTSWVYSLRRDSFVTKVLGWARQQKTLRVVSDQVSNPTWARMLAEATAQLAAKAGNQPASYLANHSGVYHLAGSGHASRLEWAQAILGLDKNRDEQIVEKIVPAATSDFPTPAQRPLFSALDCSKIEQTFGLCLPTWNTALSLAMEGIQ